MYQIWRDLLRGFYLFNVNTVADGGVGSAESFLAEEEPFLCQVALVCTGEWLVCTASCLHFMMLWLCWALGSLGFAGWQWQGLLGPHCGDAESPELSHPAWGGSSTTRSPQDRPWGVQPYCGRLSDLDMKLVDAGKRAEPKEGSSGAQAGLQFCSLVNCRC